MKGGALIGGFTSGLPESKQEVDLPIVEYSPLVEQSGEHGVAAASESLNGDVDESVVGSWAGARVREVEPLLELVQSRFALAQTQFLHLPPPLQRQHSSDQPRSTR